ncbi:MAG: hypothetical protein KGM42_11540 [Hyphomicrobiales bacterium]|nr:hypothetical protein [Hyphomicrobiales bacterium]
MAAAVETDSATETGGRRKVEEAGALSAAAAVAALYAVTHPFDGIAGDSKIYMGRALADLDPGGVGRDLMFRLDQQSGFSVFPKIAAWLVAHTSLSAAAMLLVAASSILWFSAGVVLTGQVARDRVWSRAAIAFVAPAFYGGFSILRYAEPLAEPRPFAEAFVVFAIAAYLAERRLTALALLVLAALFHPLMAAAGVGVLYFCLCAEDRRWIAVAITGLIVVSIGAVVGAPVVARLGVIVDPDWFRFLEDRNAYLLPRLWPATAFVLPAVQALTLLLGAAYAGAAVRRVLVSTLAVGLVGLAVAWFVSDIAHDLLLLQLQTWRMWWLAGFASALALGLCALRLGAGSPREKIALALLVLSWTFSDSWGAVALAALAFVVARATLRLRLDVTDRVARLALIGACCAVVAPAAMNLTQLVELVRGEPGYAPGVLDHLNLAAGDVLLLVCVLLAAFGAPRALARLPRGLVAAFSVIALLGAGVLWNDANSYEAALDKGVRQVDLDRLIGADGDVLWIDATIEPWAWLGRPSWNSYIQAAGSVFSRELAMTYLERARFLIDDGLGDATLVARYANRQRVWHRPLTPRNVATLCARADAPAAILAAVAVDATLDPALKAHIWTPPAVRVESVGGGEKEAGRIERYAVVRCADHR